MEAATFASPIILLGLLVVIGAVVLIVVLCTRKNSAPPPQPPRNAPTHVALCPYCSAPVVMGDGRWQCPKCGNGDVLLNPPPQ